MNDKPFIKLLKSPLAWYFFDVNTQRIVEIDQDVYEYLEQILNGNETETSSDMVKKLDELLSEGLLSCKRPKRIEHPETKWLEYHYERNLSKITLQLTQGCNLRCSYCIYSNDSYNQRSHSTKRMSFDVAKKAVDFLLCHSADQDQVNISFYGGEPLIEFDLMKRIVDYVSNEAIGKEITYNITTNGTLLNKEIVEFFIAHKIDVLISLDGPQKTHDESRKFAKDGRGSFKTIIKNIKRALIKHPDFVDRLTFNMVINPQNDYDYLNSLKNDYKELCDIKIRSTIIDDVNSVEKITISKDYQSKNKYNIFLAFLSRADRLGKEFVLATAREFIDNYEKRLNELIEFKELPNVMAPGGPCIPGQMRLFISTEGVFFPCERVSEISKSMNIGDLNSGIRIKSAEKLLNIGRITKKKCMDCWAITMCGLCCKHADDGFDLNPEVKNTHCANQIYSANEFLLNKIMIDEIRSIY